MISISPASRPRLTKRAVREGEVFLNENPFAVAAKLAKCYVITLDNGERAFQSLTVSPPSWRRTVSKASSRVHLTSSTTNIDALNRVMPDDGPNITMISVRPVFEAGFHQNYMPTVGSEARSTPDVEEQLCRGRSEVADADLADHFANISHAGGTCLIKIDVEGHKRCVDRALSPHNLWCTLFLKDLAEAHAGLLSGSIVDVYAISIRNRSGRTFRHFAFFTCNDTEWRRIT
jgi:hypothetical protein